MIYVLWVLIISLLHSIQQVQSMEGSDSWSVVTIPNEYQSDTQRTVFDQQLIVKTIVMPFKKQEHCLILCEENTLSTIAQSQPGTLYQLTKMIEIFTTISLYYVSNNLIFTRSMDPAKEKAEVIGYFQTLCKSKIGDTMKWVLIYKDYKTLSAQNITVDQLDSLATNLPIQPPLYKMLLDIFYARIQYIYQCYNQETQKNIALEEINARNNTKLIEYDQKKIGYTNKIVEVESQITIEQKNNKFLNQLNESYRQEIDKLEKNSKIESKKLAECEAKIKCLQQELTIQCKTHETEKQELKDQISNLEKLLKESKNMFVPNSITPITKSAKNQSYGIDYILYISLIVNVFFLYKIYSYAAK